MRERLADLSYPQMLVVVLAVVVASSLAVAGLTSSLPVSGYNTDWDGTSDLRGMAQDRGSLVVARDVDRYSTVSADDTVAIVHAPRSTYTSDEVETIRRFVEQGGTLVVAADFQPGANRLLADLESDVRLDGTPVRDERRYHEGPDLPVATTVSDSAFTAGVDDLTLNHGTHLQVEGQASTVVRTSEYAYADANRDGQLSDDEEMRAYPVVAVESKGQGTLVIVSDGSVFLNAMLTRTGNDQFAAGLLSRGSTHLLDYSHLGGVPLVPATILTIRASLALQMALGLVVIALLGLFYGRELRDVADAPNETER